MTIKSRFKNGAFMPTHKIGEEFRENEVVEIEIRKKKEFSWRGALKRTSATSVPLQHKIKKMW
jgi:hypothetical protein